jgi:hypothetical protein
MEAAGSAGRKRYCRQAAARSNLIRKPSLLRPISIPELAFNQTLYHSANLEIWQVESAARYTRLTLRLASWVADGAVQPRTRSGEQSSVDRARKVSTLIAFQRQARREPPPPVIYSYRRQRACCGADDANHRRRLLVRLRLRLPHRSQLAIPVLYSSPGYTFVAHLQRLQQRKACEFVQAA